MPRLSQGLREPWLFFWSQAAVARAPGNNKSLLLLTPDRQVVQLAVLGQAGLGLGVGALLALLQGRVVGISWLLGGLVAVVPNAFLAARLMSPRAGADAKALLRAVWIGEIGKFAITVLLFAAIFAAVRPLSALAVFGGFIAAQLVVIGVLALGGRVGDEQAVTKN